MPYLCYLEAGDAGYASADRGELRVKSPNRRPDRRRRRWRSRGEEVAEAERWQNRRRDDAAGMKATPSRRLRNLMADKNRISDERETQVPISQYRVIIERFVTYSLPLRTKVERRQSFCAR